jgi:hypothetical protein
MHAGDHGIGGQHQLASCGGRQQCRVVGQIEGARAGEPAEMPGDQVEFGGERRQV